MTQQITAETRQKLTEIVNAGLVGGLGEPRPGSLCLEAAVCLALGEPHGDKPSCVAEPDRVFAIRLNDAAWSSTETRAQALLPLALAQLGTTGTDRSAWVQALALGTVQRVLPIALRAADLTEHAERCAQATTLEEARAAAWAAYAAAARAADAYTARAADAWAAFSASFAMRNCSTGDIYPYQRKNKARKN
jgi:hypothetical protein